MRQGHAPFWHDVARYMGFWFLVGIFAGTQNIATTLYYHHTPEVAATLATQVLNWVTCGASTPLYLWLTQRFPLSGGRVPQTATIYLSATLLGVVVKFAIDTPIRNLFFHAGVNFQEYFFTNIFGVWIDQFYAFVLISAVEYYRTTRERTLRAAHLEHELSLAQLDTLQSQLQPHFLFNTLNSISALMHRDVASADIMLARLSDMLRLTLESHTAQEVALRHELEILQLYLEIMHVRFGERLRTDIDIADRLLTERVPRFLLQPLVENAVRHGIDESSRMTTIHISGSTDADSLLLRIVDDGRGLPTTSPLREGIGLSNTRRRLKHLYGTTGTLCVGQRAGGGTEVVVRIPRRIGLVADGAPA